MVSVVVRCCCCGRTTCVAAGGGTILLMVGNSVFLKTGLVMYKTCSPSHKICMRGGQEDVNRTNDGHKTIRRHMHAHEFQYLTKTHTSGIVCMLGSRSL